MIHTGWLASQVPAWWRMRRGLADPDRAQHQRLASLLPTLAASAYGRSVRLDRVRTVADLRRLPVLEAADLRPWVDRVAAGEPAVLTPEPVEVLEPTGGSTSGTRYVPVTRRMRAELGLALGAWMVDLHRRTPRLVGTRSYWSLSRAVRAPATSAGGIPLGFDDDAAWLGPVQRWAVRRLFAVSGDVARSACIETWRRRTVTALVECDDLGLISVWSPTFLALLLDWLDAHRDDLALSPAARSRLEAAWTGARVDAATLWPRLAVVSAWGDAFAAEPLAALARRLPGVAVQPKGLLATEGVVSIPLGPDDGAVLAVTAHVIELRDLSDGAVVAPSAARLDAEYQPLLTTGAGLVRYALPDAVRVVGFAGRAPRIRLVSRLDRGSDLVGEKLTAGFVDKALGALSVDGRRFAMLVPARDRYTLVVDGVPPSSDALDAALRDAYHYAYARDLGQLAPPVVTVVPDAWARWEAAVESLGLSLGSQKPQGLETRPDVVQRLLDDVR